MAILDKLVCLEKFQEMEMEYRCKIDVRLLPTRLEWLTAPSLCENAMTTFCCITQLDILDLPLLTISKEAQAFLMLRYDSGSARP